MKRKALVVLSTCCFVAAIVSLRVHTPRISEDMLDAIRGFFFGLAISFTFFAVRANMRWRA